MSFGLGGEKEQARSGYGINLALRRCSRITMSRTVAGKKKKKKMYQHAVHRYLPLEMRKGRTADKNTARR